MICQNCQKRQANVHIMQIINGGKVEIHLCEQCANEKGQINLGLPLNISDFFSGLMGNDEKQPVSLGGSSKIVCQNCGFTYDDFQKTGKFGCAACYKMMGDSLKPVLKRLHGNIRHSGKIPLKHQMEVYNCREIDKLKDMLSQAVKKEEYEKAAEIRDRIKVLEREV